MLDSDPLQLYRSTILSLARSLAKIQDVPWDRIRDPLFSQCPSENALSLSEKNQDALIALGIFLLESKGAWKERIVPHLLQVISRLHITKIQVRKSPDGSEWNVLLGGMGCVGLHVVRLHSINNNLSDIITKQNSNHRNILIQMFN
ncbi:Uncharacterized protein FKW44_002741, partial [Caligus rogercresseyi]